MLNQFDLLIVIHVMKTLMFLSQVNILKIIKIKNYFYEQARKN